MNLPGKRLLLGTTITAAALGVGGFAYAAGNDPAPDQGYVTVEEGPGSGTTSQGADNGQGTTSPGDRSSANPQGRDGAARDGKDCPDKAGQPGSAEGQGAQPSLPDQSQTQPDQGQAQPDQGEVQPIQPEQQPDDVASNA